MVLLSLVSASLVLSSFLCFSLVYFAYCSPFPPSLRFISIILFILSFPSIFINKHVDFQRYVRISASTVINRGADVRRTPGIYLYTNSYFQVHVPIYLLIAILFITTMIYALVALLELQMMQFRCRPTACGLHQSQYFPSQTTLRLS